MKPDYPTVSIFEVHYAAIPENYPQLPLSSFDQQPASYTQGNASEIHVAILLPVREYRRVVYPENVSVVIEDGEPYYVCNLNVEYDARMPNERQLAMIHLQVSVAEQFNEYLNWKIIVNDSGNDEGTPLGKVVMDSNILPTQGE